MCCWRLSPSIHPPCLEITWRTSELLRLTLVHSTNGSLKEGALSLTCTPPQIIPSKLVPSSQLYLASGLKVKCGLGV